MSVAVIHLSPLRKKRRSYSFQRSLAARSLSSSRAATNLLQAMLFRRNKPIPERNLFVGPIPPWPFLAR
jgi:hypothetical protein